MQTEIADRTILVNMIGAAEGLPRGEAHSVGLDQIRMWLFPQKSENDHEFDINPAYFESLLNNSLQSLLAQGLITSSPAEDIEYGDSANYSLTDKGYKFAEKLELAEA